MKMISKIVSPAFGLSVLNELMILLLRKKKQVIDLKILRDIYFIIMKYLKEYYMHYHRSEDVSLPSVLLHNTINGYK